MPHSKLYPNLGACLSPESSKTYLWCPTGTLCYITGWSERIQSYRQTDTDISIARTALTPCGCIHDILDHSASSNLVLLRVSDETSSSLRKGHQARGSSISGFSLARSLACLNLCSFPVYSVSLERPTLTNAKTYLIPVTISGISITVMLACHFFQNLEVW
jgi:hypothetical protein